MAQAAGFEPATSGVTGRCSGQLSYARLGVFIMTAKFTHSSILLILPEIYANSSM